MPDPIPPHIDFVDYGRKICLTVFDIVRRAYNNEMESEEVPPGEHKDINNITRKIDKITQSAAVEAIHQFQETSKQEILVLGEEIGKYPDTLENENRLVAFVDPLDGTDLVVKGFGNWCLALLFFDPAHRKIIASIIGHSSGEVYYATDRGAWKEKTITIFDGASKWDHTKPTNLTRNPSQIIDIENASICFYGQKPKNFLSFAKKDKFLSLLEIFGTRMTDGPDHPRERLNMRLYNFGGNPMMAKLANGDVDAVLGLSPAQVHDVIPGAYIAKQAGALFTDLQNQPINLVQALLKPEKRLEYLLTASEALHKQLLPLVQLQ